jgi:hypothetical protein
MAIIQIKTNARISAPMMTRLHELVLDHDTPQMLEHKNSLTYPKNQASTRFALTLCATF